MKNAMVAVVLVACGPVEPRPGTLDEPVYRRSAPPAAEHEAGRLVIHGTQPMFCARSETTKESVCDERESVCLDAAAQMRKRGVDLNACSTYTAAACFVATLVLSGKREMYCAASVELCDLNAAGFARDADWRDVSTPCALYRQQ